MQESGAVGSYAQSIPAGLYHLLSYLKQQLAVKQALLELTFHTTPFRLIQTAEVNEIFA